MDKTLIARATADGRQQTLTEHLLGVSEIARKLADKMQLPHCGALVGLLHDFGKASAAFQTYIRQVTGIDPDIDDGAKNLKGKIDHSSAGAQWLNQELTARFKKYESGRLFSQLLASCIAAHHSGLMDFAAPNGSTHEFDARMKKADEKTHLQECIERIGYEILEKADALIPKAIEELNMLVRNQFLKEKPIARDFYLGCLCQFLFSCLIDADRINSADFEIPHQSLHRQYAKQPDWQVAINALEAYLANLSASKPIDHIRKQISKDCLSRATDAQGSYTLTVPTGGGKTLASLRFALHHAKTHGLSRIIYIIPYTSIIEQNAQVVRDRLGDDWVLEQHSNLQPEHENWRNKLAAENWDSPIVFTTMVQFLDAWFAGGTRSARHIHPMSNAVLIFDEIQTLPIRCVHLFCNTINFLTKFADSTAVMCTATQPLLGKLKYPEKGQLTLAKNSEIMGDTQALLSLFDALSRTEIHYQKTAGGWNVSEAADFLLEQFDEHQSCLFIVNTKRWAKSLYESCLDKVTDPKAIFHLSTSMCAAHRKVIFSTIKERLKHKLPVICISTQLIEAGVDISFSCVIRALAGLDSIAQAAGRCNRSGEQKGKGKVYVLNLADEPLHHLPDIAQAQKAAKRVLREDTTDVLSPEKMKSYFQYYFYDRSEEMDYPIADSTSGTLLEWLSSQSKNILNSKNDERLSQGKYPLLNHAFKSAGEAFKAIDASTKGVIVPHGEGQAIITALCGEYDAAQFYENLRKAQPYSINIFGHEWEKLARAGALIEIVDSGVYYLSERYYSDAYGLMTDGQQEMTAQIY